MKTISTMRLLGGRLSLDLVNTVHARRDTWGPDLLNRHEDLMIWSERTGLLVAAEIEEARSAAADNPSAAQGALVRTKELREVIAEVLGAIAEHCAPSETAAATFCAEADQARRYQRLITADAQFAWAWNEEHPLERIAHRVALDAATIVMDSLLRMRVKLCPGSSCGWLFLDETKNGTRRWCRDGDCGARTRMSHYRAKKS